MFKAYHLSKEIKGKKIINEISFELGYGQIAILLGESGVGKSTLLRVLNGLEDRTTGYFLLDGKSLVPHDMGMVFQNFNLFEHLTVEENITLALIQGKKLTKKEAIKVAEKQLERYGLLLKRNESVHRLSGGQKQRLAIARTVALNPKMICLDEPTSALDPRLTEHVASSIRELAGEGRIVLLTTHNPKLLEQLDATIYYMENGTIAATTHTSQLHQNPKITQFLSAVDFKKLAF